MSRRVNLFLFLIIIRISTIWLSKHHASIFACYVQGVQHSKQYKLWADDLGSMREGVGAGGRGGGISDKEMWI